MRKRGRGRGGGWGVRMRTEEELAREWGGEEEEDEEGGKRELDVSEPDATGRGKGLCAVRRMMACMARLRVPLHCL